MLPIQPLPPPATALDTVRGLLTSETSPCVTLYLPLRRTWNGPQHDRTLLRTLTDEAHDRLRRRGLSSEQADTILGPPSTSTGTRTVPLRTPTGWPSSWPPTPLP